MVFKTRCEHRGVRHHPGTIKARYSIPFIWSINAPKPNPKATETKIGLTRYSPAMTKSDFAIPGSGCDDRNVHGAERRQPIT